MKPRNMERYLMAAHIDDATPYKANQRRLLDTSPRAPGAAWWLMTAIVTAAIVVVIGLQ